MAKVRITQVRSIIDRPQRQKDTIKALGLRKMNQSVEIDLVFAVTALFLVLHAEGAGLSSVGRDSAGRLQVHLQIYEQGSQSLGPQFCGGIERVPVNICRIIECKCPDSACVKIIAKFKLVRRQNRIWCRCECDGECSGSDRHRCDCVDEGRLHIGR